MKIGRLLRKQTSRHRKVRLGLFVALALTLILVAAGRIINSPATGTITRFGVLAAQSSNPAEPNKQYDGKYISFSYPSKYTAVPTELSGSYLEVYRIYSPRHTDRFIALGVVRGSVENDSGVNLRRNHLETYKPQPAPAGSLIFLSRQNGFERTVFIAHSDLVISIAAVDAAGNDITADQQEVFDSLKWK